MSNDVSRDFLKNPGGFSGNKKSKYKNGTYTAFANGIGGRVKVILTVDSNNITNIIIETPNETPELGQKAAPKLKEEILKKQSTEVDVISGASVTSKAVIQAVNKCLAQAKGEKVEATEKKVDKPGWLDEEPVIDDSNITKTIIADIIIMGGGDSGAMCAFAAAEEGASVAVIEEQAKDSIFYYGLHDIASINSNFAIKRGAPEIRKSEFIAEYQRRSHNRTNPRLIKKFVDNSGEMIDWLVAHSPKEVVDKAVIHNVDFLKNYDYLPRGKEVNKFTSWCGTVQFDFNAAATTLVEQAENRKAEWYWETRGVKLLVTEKIVQEKAEKTDSTGKVSFYDKDVTKKVATGLIAKDKAGNYIKFVANKAVVLAGGDYGGNPEMYAALQDEKRELYKSHDLDTSELKCAGFGRDGSGIKMAMWAGATMDPGPRTLVDPQVVLGSETYASNVLRWGASFHGAENPWGSPFVWLDSSGKRFSDETFLGVFGMRQRVERMKPGRYYAIFDSHWSELMSKMTPEHFSLPVGKEDDADLHEIFNSWVERGALGAKENEGDSVCAWGADTLSDLLDYMGFDQKHKKTIQKEIVKYNQYCARGEDEDFGRDPKLLLPVDKGPFYGMYCVEEKPMTGTVTLNGVNIDSNQKVLDGNYNPIEKLYATGNNSGGRFAIEYCTPMQGLTLGLAMTLGRVLGIELANM
ncbi:FAD-binding protein [Ligilactobacillus sp. WILCCON 0076]|uniref:Urocanate reductase n=1 Tax=Ligilactobacillus ubinensis TaxID=2876789 RepID=A0A9X2FJL8_9LACO|nr:FAD-binding protein [Ligilactobacillus ubinensis]MCP0886585.1 FAD-binding protein [Ligilactobacillus ubinensis]